MTAPLIAKKTYYLKTSVPYYKYYKSENIDTDSQELFSSATATVGGQECYAQEYSFKGYYTSTASATFPTSGSGMTTSIITPSSYSNKSVTLSAWVKPAQNNESAKSIWGCHADSTASGISFGMDDSQAGRIKFHAISYGGVLRSTSTLAANTWYFIVCVYNMEDHTMKIYINGNQNASQTIPTNPTGTAYELKFGYYIWKAGFWSGTGVTSKTTNQACQQAFVGNIINCCTWYRALTASEISTLYNNGSGLKIDTSVSPYTDVAIAYPMNETSGTTSYSAITGQDTGRYGNNTTYNQHVDESIFAGVGVVPSALYMPTTFNWETDLQVSQGSEFVSDLTLVREIVPTKIKITLDNPSPKNPVNLELRGSLDGYNWEYLKTVSIPSNTNQTIEEDITSSTEYPYYRISTTNAYLTTGLTIKNITISGYWILRTEVGKHQEWDESEEVGTHTVLGNESDYDEVEYIDQEYEVENV